MNRRSRCKQNLKNFVIYTTLFRGLTITIFKDKIEYEYDELKSRTEIHKTVSEKMVSEIRAVDLRQAGWLLILIWMLQQRSVGFQPVRQALPPSHYQLFGGTSDSLQHSHNSKSSHTPSSLQMKRPSSIPHSEYIKMKPQERRSLPHVDDGYYRKKGLTDLRVGFNQVEYKMPKHGKDHGLQPDNGNKISKSRTNVLFVRDDLLSMPDQEGVKRYEDGMFQGGTELGFETVNIFDSKRGLIAIYKKNEDGKPAEYVSSFKITPMERDHLISSSGNFVTQSNLKNPKVIPILKNLTNTENKK
jgi:hypothetical protein